MPHRKKLLSLLENYQRSDEHQAIVKNKINDFVKKNANCFSRSNLFGHITGSCLLLSSDKKKVLLTHHKKIGLWLQLGGHADGEWDILRVALREAKEESGIEAIEPICEGIFDLDIHKIPPHKKIPAHFHFDIRFVFVSHHQRYSVSKESYDLAWVDLDDLVVDFNIDESVRRMVKKWLTR